MSKFVLKPARVLQTRLSPLKEEPAEEYTLEELVRKFIPRKEEGVKLSHLKKGCFFGLVKGRLSPENVFVFILHHASGKGDLEAVLKADPTFTSRLLCAYKVEEAVFDTKFIEDRQDLAQ